MKRTRTKTSEVKLTRSDKEIKGYGKISILEFSNKSRIYISKKGWNITLPLNKRVERLIKKRGYVELNINYDEMRLALKETLSYPYLNLVDEK